MSLVSLERDLRRRLVLCISNLVFDAYMRGLPRHLVVYELEAAVSEVLDRLRAYDLSVRGGLRAVEDS